MKLFLFFALTLVSAGAHAKTWGPVELEEATHHALRQLRLEVGEGAYQNVVEFKTTLKRQKIAADVEVTYERGGSKMTESFYCHQHGADIDCH